MIKIIRLSVCRYMITCGKDSMFVENVDSLYRAAVALGISMDEVNAAIDDMESKDNDIADFGVNKMFTFSTRWQPDCFKYPN